jgi:hypothetical protein
MNKTELLNKIKEQTLKMETIHVDLWNSDVFIRELSGKQYVELASKAVVDGVMNQSSFLDHAIITSVFTIDGEQVFSNDDLELISNLSADVYSLLVETISKLNNISGVNSKGKN